MIARLKVESSEYDSKIKRAAQGIQHLVEACHNAGGVLNVLEDENREFIKSLGSMETVSKSARGKIAELTAAFTDLKSVYNSLSQEEKNGEVGKELIHTKVNNRCFFTVYQKVAAVLEIV